MKNDGLIDLVVESIGGWEYPTKKYYIAYDYSERRFVVKEAGQVRIYGAKYFSSYAEARDFVIQNKRKLVDLWRLTDDKM